MVAAQGHAVLGELLDLGLGEALLADDAVEELRELVVRKLDAARGADRVHGEVDAEVVRRALAGGGGELLALLGEVLLGDALVHVEAEEVPEQALRLALERGGGRVEVAGLGDVARDLVEAAGAVGRLRGGLEVGADAGAELVLARGADALQGRLVERRDDELAAGLDRDGVLRLHAAERLLVEVLGKFDVGLERLAGLAALEELREAGDGEVVAADRAPGALLLGERGGVRDGLGERLAVRRGGVVDAEHVLGRGGVVRPEVLERAERAEEAVDLALDLLLRDRGVGVVDRDAVELRELHVGDEVDGGLERDGAVGRGLAVVDGDDLEDLELLLLDGLLEGLADGSLGGVGADAVCVVLLDEGGGRLALAEAGQGGLRGVFADDGGAGLGGLVGGDGDGKDGAGAGLGGDFGVHGEDVRLRPRGGVEKRALSLPQLAREEKRDFASGFSAGRGGIPRAFLVDWGHRAMKRVPKTIPSVSERAAPPRARRRAGPVRALCALLLLAATTSFAMNHVYKGHYASGAAAWTVEDGHIYKGHYASGAADWTFDGKHIYKGHYASGAAAWTFEGGHLYKGHYASGAAAYTYENGHVWEGHYASGAAAYTYDRAHLWKGHYASGAAIATWDSRDEFPDGVLAFIASQLID